MEKDIIMGKIKKYLSDKWKKVLFQMKIYEKEL